LKVWILIRILPSLSKNSKKNLYFYCSVTLYDFLSLKNDINVPSKSNKQKKLGQKYLLLVSWRTLMKRAGSGAGSVPKCHGSGTLLVDVHAKTAG
jgi:hypothetical protein